MSRRLSVIHFLILLLLVASGCHSSLHRYEFNQPKMGAGFRIVLYAKNKTEADKAAQAAYARVDQLNSILSDYDPSSEISRLSLQTADGAMTTPAHVSDELFAVLKRSLEVAEQSGGAFDITVGPFTKLWRRSRDLQKLPTTQRLDEARATVGYKLVKLDAENHTVQLLAPRMRLDVAGLAGGYIVDETLAVLRRAGIDHALIDEAGDLGMTKPPPGEKGWRVGIQTLEAPEQMTGEYVQLANYSISTSGDTYRYVEIDGKRYSHIVDPKTGLGMTSRTGVTVIAPDGITCDWLDTAIPVMGRAAGSNLIESIPGTAARITTIDDAGRITVSETSRWRQFVVPAARTRLK